MKFETERLILREYKEEDFDDLYEVISDPETMKYYETPYSSERTHYWIEWSLNNYKEYGFGLWAVILKENGKFIGDCGITMQNIDGEMLPEIGYHINKNYWRKGYGKEAAKVVRDWAFSNTKFERLYSYMNYLNVPSYSLASSIGMKRIKEYIDPKGHKMYVYSISKDEWMKNK